MEVRLAVVSDFAYVEAGTGKLYILGLFRYLHAREVPFVFPRMAVTFVIEAPLVEVRQGIAPIQIELTDGDGRPVMPRSPQMEIRFGAIGPAAPGQALAQVTLELAGLQFPAYGDYSVHLFGPGDRHLGAANFTVTPPPPAQPT